MKILTFGASPYINTNLGKINKSLILGLKKSGHLVASAVWGHDLSWYLPDEDRYFFEQDNEKICQIYPFNNINVESSATFMYDIIFALNPDILITSGDIEDMEYTFAIKSLYPEKFKWIAYLTIPSFPINERKIDQLKMIDKIFVSTERAKKELDDAGIESEYCSFGPSDFYIYDDNKTEDLDGKLNIIVNSKNNTISNIGNMFKACSFLDENYSIYLHTNYSDPGDYDIDLLKSRYDKNNIVRLPDSFVGINEGILECDLKHEYLKADVIMDISTRSSTAISVLEGMRMGCIPLVSRVGALAEIYNLFDISGQYCMNGCEFLSYGESELTIVNPREIATYINKLRNNKKQFPERIKDLKNKAITLSSEFSEEKFSEKIMNFIRRIFLGHKELKIETF